MDFEAFVSDIEKNEWNVYGVEVYKAGKLAHSYGDTTEKHNIYSATKTVLSLAIGIAVDRGFIDVNNCVLDYLPRANVSKMRGKSLEAYKKIRLHDLMCMSVSSLPFQVSSENYLDYALSFPVVAKKAFNYSNNSAYLAGVALAGALGCDVGTFIEENIFKVLEITDFSYKKSPEGYFYGASKMELSVSSLSKIALVIYNGGTYGGKRIVSADYIKRATSIQQMNREGGYGYFLWKYRDGVSINGKWGQKCYILPENELMISYLSHIDDNCVVRDSMERHILGVC